MEMNPAKILIVDDDQTLLKFFKIHLNKFFSRVIVVKNAKEAVETLKSKQIDLVLSDIRMPRVDGLQLGGAASRWTTPAAASAPARRAT